MHFHTQIYIFIFDRDSYGHLRMIINDDSYLQRVEVSLLNKAITLIVFCQTLNIQSNLEKNLILFASTFVSTF